MSAINPITIEGLKAQARLTSCVYK